MSLPIPHVGRYLMTPEEDIGSPGTRTSGSCESPDMSPRNQSIVLCKTMQKVLFTTELSETALLKWAEGTR